MFLKRSVPVLAIATLLALPHVAQASSPLDGFYVDAGVGAGIPNDTTLKASRFPHSTFSVDDGFDVAGGVGYHVTPWARVEGEIGHFGADLGSGTFAGLSIPSGSTSLDVTTYMANGFLDWCNGTPFTPYISVGIGAATIGASTSSASPIQVNNSDTVFAWQAGVGGAYQISSHFSAILDWRYLQTSDASFNGTVGPISVPFKAAFSANLIRTGLRYDF